MTGHPELWVLGLLAAVAGLVMLSNRLGVPYPVFLVLGRLALGLVPHGRDRTLPRLAQSRDDRPTQPPAVVRVMGCAAIPAQLGAVRPHRIAASQYPRENLRRGLDDVGGAVRRAREPGGDRDAIALDVPGDLPAPLLEPVYARAQPLSPPGNKSPPSPTRA